MSSDAWASAPYTTNGFRTTSREKSEDDLKQRLRQAQEKHDQLVAENAELRRQNQELLTKFEANLKRLEEKMRKDK
jgi:predicted nuclease with TOPRIM domain